MRSSPRVFRGKSHRHGCRERGWRRRRWNCATPVRYAGCCGGRGRRKVAGEQQWVEGKSMVAVIRPEDVRWWLAMSVQARRRLERLWQGSTCGGEGEPARLLKEERTGKEGKPRQATGWARAAGVARAARYSRRQARQCPWQGRAVARSRRIRSGASDTYPRAS